MKSVEWAGSKFEVKNGFLDLGLLKIKDMEEIMGLDKIDGLKNLELSSNEIVIMRGLDALNELEILNLGSNNIKEIKGLDNLKNLEILHLISNQIKEIKGARQSNQFERIIS